ncbi:MAG: glycosyltransferase [Mogibacterium sp.]|nr:glycosyltransferase [Mogibacterium sp.]
MKSGHSICLLNDSFPPIIDGVANTVMNYAKIIERSHGHSMVVTPRVPGVKSNDDYDFPVIRYPSIDTRKLIGYVTGYPFSPEVAHAATEERIDLLHSHCPAVSTLMARELAESMRLPLVLTWHTKFDIDIANAVKSKLIQAGALHALRYNVNACDEIWTVSKGAGENLKSIGYEGDYIVMPNGVDLPREKVPTDIVDKVTEGYDLPSDLPCYLFVGRLMWYKGIRIILDALAKLKSEGVDYRCVLVGDGGEGGEMRDYAAEIGIDDKVFFTGAISEREALRAWYCRADLFLFPSAYDTNGLVVREAAANDTASVIIKDSCASEGIIDGRNGFLIEENSESLADILITLSEAPDRVKTVGKAAGDEIYISWEAAVAKACERYEVVKEKYRAGDYGVHDPLRGSWLQSQGELMQILGEIDMNMRFIRDKAVTEIKSVGYEAKENLSDKAKNIWTLLDRYL